MVYYVFDKFESSIGNGLLRLNRSRSMALTFPTVPGKYYEMSFCRSIAAFDVNRSSDVGTFFNLLKKALGLILTLICHTLTHLNRWPSHFLIDRRRLLWNEFHNYLSLRSISHWIYTEHCFIDDYRKHCCWCLQQFFWSSRYFRSLYVPLPENIKRSAALIMGIRVKTVIYK